MLDIGLGEVMVIAVVALLVFGPDRLPKAAAEAARAVRQLRQVASSARQDLVSAAGLEDAGEVTQAISHLKRELDPREPEPRRAAGPSGAAAATQGAGASAAGRAAAPVVAPAPQKPSEIQVDDSWS